MSLSKEKFTVENIDKVKNQISSIQEMYVKFKNLLEKNDLKAKYNEKEIQISIEIEDRILKILVVINQGICFSNYYKECNKAIDFFYDMLYMPEVTDLTLKIADELGYTIHGLSKRK